MTFFSFYKQNTKYANWHNKAEKLIKMTQHSMTNTVFIDEESLVVLEWIEDATI
jgi:hypothetical protein